MNRRQVIEYLRSEIHGTYKKHKEKIRHILETEAIEELQGKLTPEEIEDIFRYKPFKQKSLWRDSETLWIIVCQTCGRYSNLRWHYEGVPDIDGVWKTLTVGKKLYSPKDNILNCLGEGHEVKIRPHDELVEARCLKQEIKETELFKNAEELLKKII